MYVSQGTYIIRVLQLPYPFLFNYRHSKKYTWGCSRTALQHNSMATFLGGLTPNGIITQILGKPGNILLSTKALVYLQSFLILCVFQFRIARYWHANIYIYSRASSHSSSVSFCDAINAPLSEYLYNLSKYLTCLGKEQNFVILFNAANNFEMPVWNFRYCSSSTSCQMKLQLYWLM